MYNILKCFINKVACSSMPKRAGQRTRKFNTSKKIKIEHNPNRTGTSSSQQKQNLNLNTLNTNTSTSSMMSLNSKVEVLNTPIKSANDKKDYKVIRLPNGLIACLVSDPSNNFVNVVNGALDQSDTDEDEVEEETTEDEECASSENEISDDPIEDDEEGDGDTRRLKSFESEEKLAAASLCVGVGSFSDPKSIPGLAHFLEHMVFMGSEKYQQENDFDAFLKKRGGSDNASTDAEMTTFYFECLEKYLGKALDIWSQFFIAPLMKKDSMTREREAIESEFQMALPSDNHRKEQMISSFATENSPVNKFMWGNLKTLRDNVGDDYLYEQVHEFRKRHYSANRMTLAIQARLPLDVLETYVVDMFSGIPNNDLSGDNFNMYSDNIFNNAMFNRIYYVKPVKDVYQVDLTFAMPSLLHLYKSKPHQYVSWLLGHEGKGSLLSYLKEKIWVHAIYTGNSESGMEHNSMYALFTVTLVLTPDGINHIYEIIEAIFSYINLLKQVGPQERIYNEIKTIEDTSFRFKEEETASDFVEDLAQAMHYFPPEDYLRGSELYMEYNPDAIKMVLDKLNPKNVNIMILSSVIPENIKYDKLEPWFSVDYTDLDIPQDCFEKWLNVKPMSCFSLPADNKFLAVNFDLLNSGESIPLYPEKLIDSELVELWYKADNKFQLPHAFIHYYFTNNYALDSALNSCMVDLFVNVLLFQLTEEAYPAHVADLSYAITVHDYGILVKVHGYNDKLPILLELIIEYIKKMPQTTNENLFNAVKDIQTRSYYNTFIKPAKLAKAVRLSVLQNKCWHALAKHQAITNVTFSDFIKFSSDYLKSMHIQSLIQGNISKERALETNNKVTEILEFIPITQENIAKIQINEIENDKMCFRVKSFNKTDTNSIVTTYYQIGAGDLKTLVTLDTMMLLMEEPLFDVLRTKEQLGYDVHCMLHDTYGILGYSITVNTQAKKFSTEHVDERIDEFLRQLNKTIKRMPNKKIDEIKENLIKIKQVADVHLKDEVCRNWNEIVQQDFFFDRIPKEIEAIQQLRNTDIRKWLEKFSLDDKFRRKLSIQVVGHSAEDGDESANEVQPPKEEIKLEFINNIGKTNPSGYTYITNLEEYRTKLKLLPVHKITT